MKRTLFATALALAVVSATLTSATLAHSAEYGQQYAQNYERNYGQGYMTQNAPQQVQRAQPQQAPQYAPLRAAPQANDPARKVSIQLESLRTFLTQAQAQAQNGTIDADAALSYIEKQIAPDIDFVTMARMSLGRLAQRMEPPQRAQALNALRRNFTTKLVEAMGDMRATRFTVGTTRPGSSRGELVVPVRLDRWRGEPLTINFRFYNAQGSWKVFDAEANGQSAILFYRGYFARQWRDGWPQNMIN
ncbi:Tgt2/MlaC family protein [Magnetovibrio blakemorei]|uniref:ABC transporter substrate-binding protein n=1 Tax=Magnetovibrio blakemorei TaxID=28181 RepID=A0A1E5Q9P6_9PROT|nr:ABC transporter substrate-binding protein [Magnetovibrio blakemorei]OEJ68401.1 hypothetical protein BEN30_06495 [Magnetovibrio blakemorei]